MYKLMTFGIPINEAMPITADGCIELTPHHEMIKAWKFREEEHDTRIVVSPTSSRAESRNSAFDEDFYSPPPGTYLIPGNMDILMGRGRHPKSSPGSLRLHDMLRQHREEYDNATKLDKTAMAEMVLTKLKLSGSRFIKIVPGGFQVCDDALARGKISHGFRNLRLKDGGGVNGKKATKRSLDDQANPHHQ
jgi:hypothetical protein